jgi:hypothetical protein
MAEQKTQAPTGGLKGAPQRELREVAPVDQGKAVRLTAAAGTVVTVPEHMAEGLKASGYKGGTTTASKSPSKS